METESGLVVSRDKGDREMGMAVNESRDLVFFRLMTVLWNYIEKLVAQVCEYNKTIDGTFYNGECYGS